MKISYYVPRRVIRANHSESIIRPSEMHLTLVNRKYEMYIIPKDKEYIILIDCKSSLIKFSSISNSTLVVNKYSDVVSSKFKIIKFMI